MSKIKKRVEHILKHNVIVQTLYRYIMSAFFKGIGFFIKIDEKLVLMNGHGYRYNDSPRAIYEKMLELGIAEDYKIVWALNEPDKFDIPKCEKIKMDTIKYFITALKSKYWISCVNIERALHFKKKETIYLNTWHGAAINKCGNAVGGRNDFHFEHIDYFCICGEYERKINIRDFNIRPESIITTGYPRNDELYRATNLEKNKYRQKFNVEDGKKVILYAPTWRDSNDGGTSYKLAPPIDWQLWEKELGDEYVVFLRTHAYTNKLMNVKFNDFVRDYSSYPEVNHLLIVADVLISDYSSIQLDYSILEKPMICFGYDYEEYNRIRGFYYDLDEVMPSGVIKTQEQLIKYIKTLDYEKECIKTRLFKNSHMEYGGNAAVECINHIFGTNYQ